MQNLSLLSDDKLQQLTYRVVKEAIDRGLINIILKHKELALLCEKNAPDATDENKFLTIAEVEYIQDNGTVMLWPHLEPFIGVPYDL